MASENSAVTMNASQNQNFVPQALPAERVVTLALLMETALLVSSVEDTESVSLPLESSYQSELLTVAVWNEQFYVSFERDQSISHEELSAKQLNNHKFNKASS